MWVFGQVWFACLVGFAVGVALDWVVRVRPLSKRVADLEDRLTTASRKLTGQDDGPEGYRRSVFDSDGFVTERNRGGLLTPSNEQTIVANDVFGGRTQQLDNPPTEVVSASGVTGVSGVDDFPGVSRLSGAWDTDRNEPVPPPVEQQPYQVPPPVEHQPYQSDLSIQWDATQAVSPVEPAPAEESYSEEPYAGRAYDDQEYADQQYLEFLRAGANHAPADPEIDESGDEFVSTGGLVHGHDYTGGAYDAYEQQAEADGEATVETTGELGEVVDTNANEVTSVLPVIRDEAPQVDSYEAYESYAAQDSYSENGYSENGYSESAPERGYQFGSYQPEEYEEPAESSSPLPRRSHGEQSIQFTPFAPFDIPFDMSDSDLADGQPRSGELTPIQEGGFQPFQKPASVSEEPYTDGAWIGDDGQLVHRTADGSESPSRFSNGAHSLVEQDDDGSSSWFNLGDAPGAGSDTVGVDGGLTQRMLPVSRPDLEHPDLLPASVFGTDTDVVYDDGDGPLRSLFEPLVPAGEIADDYSEAGGFTPPEPALGMSSADEFYGQATAPRPVRVRTGVEESRPAMTPVPQPASVDDGGGPFGPGSALPNPDGSAPSPQFRIKARTSSMVFHTESSPFYDRLEPQVWFRDAEDAQRAGFTSWERPRGW